MIEINPELAFVINNEIFNKSNSLYFSNEYTKKQLGLIKELKLTNLSSLKDINLLPNLKRLYIISEDFNKLASYMNLFESNLLNHIQDFKPIEKLVNLEELIIENDIYLKKLNLKRLTKLKRLELINNPNLETLLNLDKLTNLEHIIIYGTNINNNFNFKQYSLNTFSATNNILDMSMYNKAIENDTLKAKYFSTLHRLNYCPIKFAEKTGFFNKVLLNPTETYEIFKEIETVFKKNKVYKIDDLEKIKFVYNYVMSSVDYDNQGVLHRDKLYLKALYEDNLKKHKENDFTKIHSSYNALVLGKSNCEGYVNLMRFMLNLLDIKSRNVYTSKRGYDQLGFYNHSIIKVQYNNEWYYCDPTCDSPTKFNYFMLNLNEITKTHVLNPLEMWSKYGKYFRDSKCKQKRFNC